MQQREFVITATAAALLAALVPARAEAHHRPSRACSESGEVCQSVRKIDGVRKLRMWMPDRYFRRYVLCVQNPHGYAACKTFRVERLSHQRFGDVVPWRRHFASQGEGRYTVTWYRVPEYGPATDRIGSRLGFHIH